MAVLTRRSLGSASLVATAVFALLASGAASAVTVVTGVRGFEGTSQLDNCALGQCFRPPDTMGAVGTTQFLETTNGSVTVYNKATGAVTSRVDMPTFWSSVGLPGGANGDQRVLFDHYTSRWIAIGFGATGDKINIAVSNTDNALVGGWKSIQMSGVAAGGTADYPTLSMDDKGVYIATNNFTPSFTGTTLNIIPKADLFGAVQTLANKTSFVTPLASPERGFAIQAALNWQGNPTNTTAIISDSRDLNSQVFYKVNGVNAAGATQTALIDIAGSGYDGAGAGRQPDGTRVVDTLGPRISANAVQHNGRLYALATVRSDSGDFAAVRWSVVDANTGALLSTGKIQGGNYDYYEGSIAINEFGEAVIGYNRSGAQTADTNGDGKADGRISFLVQAMTVGAGGALSFLGAENLMRVSEVDDYHCGERVAPAACRQRWGDYSAVTIDPSNHHNFYAIGEYAADWAVIPGITTTARAIWHTFIAEIDFGSAPIPEPASYGLLAIGLLALSASRRKKLS